MTIISLFGKKKFKNTADLKIKIFLKIRKKKFF